MARVREPLSLSYSQTFSNFKMQWECNANCSETKAAVQTGIMVFWLMPHSFAKQSVS